MTAGRGFCSLAGYAFARLPFRGRDTLFVLYRHADGALVTVIPHHPDAFGWTDTPWAMILPGLFGSAFGTYLMRQFFRTLPTDLEEAATSTAARCGRSTGGSRCLRPNSGAVALLWVNVWNDFLWPLVMIQRESRDAQPRPGVDAGPIRFRWPVLMAASIMILLPLVLVYAVAQRAFERGHRRHRFGGR